MSSSASMILALLAPTPNEGKDSLSQEEVVVMKLSLSPKGSKGVKTYGTKSYRVNSSMPICSLFRTILTKEKLQEAYNRRWF